MTAASPRPSLGLAAAVSSGRRGAEVLRYDTSVITWRRVTTRPSTVGQVEIPAAAKILLLLGSAGRDPGRFGEPETFDIHRRDARAHLAFGKGIH